MANRVYTINGVNQTVAGATTLVGIRAGTTCALEILRIWANQYQSGSPAGSMCRIQVGYQAAVLPTVVAATPQKTVETDPVSQIAGGTALAAGTCGINASAEGAGTKTAKWDEGFHNFNGYLWTPSKDESLVIAPGGSSSFYVYFPVAPSILTGWDFGVTFKEWG